MDTLHPFAQYIRTLGRGRQGSRSLTETEAYEAMSMILDGNVEPVQLGAFLMLVRVKEESPAEVAGFVRAVREHTALPATRPAVDLDWSSYAGKRRHLPWFILSALLLVENGTKVFMHGLSGRKDNRLYTPTALQALGIPVSGSMAEAADRLNSAGFAFLDLEQVSPKLHNMIGLRELLGLRSPVHTIARLLNPFQASCQLQGIFHPGYMEIHREAAQLLGQAQMAVIKGDGGEIEINPDSDSRLLGLSGGAPFEEEWPALFQQNHLKDQTLDAGRLAEVWSGTVEDEYGQGAVTATAAIALKTMGRAATIDEALAMATEMWHQRNRDRIPARA